LTKPCVRQNVEFRTYLRLENIDSEVTERKLEATIDPTEVHLDGNQGIKSGC
jgi:hypothetical protein